MKQTHPPRTGAVRAAPATTSRMRPALRRFGAGAVLAVLLALGTGGSGAVGKQLYEYVDENGIRHFSDTAPAGAKDVRQTRLQVEQRPMIRMETDRREDGSSRIVAHNLTGGPMEVEVRFAQASNIVSDPPLPRRVVVEGGGTVLVATARIADPRQDASFRVEAEGVPGDPRGRPQAVAYRLPFESGTRYAIGQAFDGSFSHSDVQNRHAVDLDVEEGTPVVAARDGVVVQVERDFFESGGDRERLAGRANYVRIMHEDDTMAVYAHLAYESVLVQPGDVVLAGERIGRAGATGFATGPHLHFVVQRNDGMRLRSIPFRFSGPDGPYTPVEHRRWQRVP
jgi:murein DD-endopeptidase MepM/ murein hydrolase activator NlpD